MEISRRGKLRRRTQTFAVMEDTRSGSAVLLCILVGRLFSVEADPQSRANERVRANRIDLFAFDIHCLEHAAKARWSQDSLLDDMVRDHQLAAAGEGRSSRMIRKRERR